MNRRFALLLVAVTLLLVVGHLYRAGVSSPGSSLAESGASQEAWTDWEPQPDTGDRILPLSLARLVETSSAIVVARYVDISETGSISMATAATSDLPDLTVPLLETEVVVDEVIKDDGDIDEDDYITYGALGDIPTSSTEVALDASADFPLLWTSDTEFILFLNREAGLTRYYIPYSACGRIVTDESTVACSDGARTVPAFLDGVSREDLIDAISDEVNSPSSTATPFPTVTPEPTP